MFCANCGKNINTGIEFCPNCGKSITGTDKYKLRMVKFVKKVIKNYLEIILWINLSLCSISGAIIGSQINNLLNRNYLGGFTLLGFIIGLFIGFVINILLGGFIATIINIDENINEIKERMK